MGSLDAGWRGQRPPGGGPRFCQARREGKDLHGSSYAVGVVARGTVPLVKVWPNTRSTSSRLGATFGMPDAQTHQPAAAFIAGAALLRWVIARDAPLLAADAELSGAVWSRPKASPT